MWWTRSRLVFVCLIVHAFGFAMIWVLFDNPVARAGGLLGLDLPILCVFATASGRFGRWHRERGSRDTFIERIWDKEWTETLWFAGPVDSGSSDSFYRRMLPNDAEHCDALYDALAAREAERFLHSTSLPFFSFALVAPGLLALALRGTHTITVVAFCAYLLPLTTNLLLEAPLDLLGRRAMLRRGEVERAAVLIAREDPVEPPLVDRRSAVVIGLLAAIFVGLPVLGVGIALFRSGGAAAQGLIIGILLGAAFVPTFWIPYAAAIRFIRQRLPFTKFPGPVSVSLLLDIQSRARYTLNTFMGIYAVFALGFTLVASPADFGMGFLGGSASFTLLYVVQLFDDQRDGPGYLQDLDQVRKRLDHAMRQLPAAS